MNPKQVKASEGVRRLYVDIETCPLIAYTWTIGKKVNLSHDNIIADPRIICIGYKWESGPVKALTWDKGKCDKAMLAQFVKVLMEADEVIAHNGDRFDVPWIRTRCAFHRIPIPHQLPTVDTLKQARRGFRFPSNRLDYLGKYMGIGRKMETGGFGLWKAVMDGDKQALHDMVEYCKRDVELLQEVHHALYSYAKPTTHIGIAVGGYRHWCPSCGSHNVKLNGNKRVTAAGVLQVEMKCKDCRSAWRMNETMARREILKEREDKLLSEGKR